MDIPVTLNGQTGKQQVGARIVCVSGKEDVKHAQELVARFACKRRKNVRNVEMEMPKMRFV